MGKMIVFGVIEGKFAIWDKFPVVTLPSGASVRKDVWVQIPPPAPN